MNYFFFIISYSPVQALYSSTQKENKVLYISETFLFQLLSATISFLSYAKWTSTHAKYSLVDVRCDWIMKVPACTLTSSYTRSVLQNPQHIKCHCSQGRMMGALCFCHKTWKRYFVSWYYLSAWQKREFVPRDHKPCTSSITCIYLSSDL